MGCIFYGEGECPTAIQNLEKDIYTDWLPSSGYEYDNGPDIELYFEPTPKCKIRGMDTG